MRHKGLVIGFIIAILIGVTGVYMVTYDVMGISALYETSKVLVVLLPVFILAIVVGVMIVKHNHHPKINPKVRTSLDVELNVPHEELKLFVKPTSKKLKVNNSNTSEVSNKKVVNKSPKKKVSMKVYSKDTHEVLSQRVKEIDKILAGLQK